MGNSQSNDAPKSPSATTTPHRESGRRERDRERERDGTQRRGSQQVSGSAHSRRAPSTSSQTPSSHASKSVAPPITSTLLPSTTATTSTTTSHAQATASASTGATSSHSRARSITASAAQGPRRDGSASSSQSTAMGNAESRHQPPSRAQTLPQSTVEKVQPTPPSPSQPVEVPLPPPASDDDAFPEPMNSPLYALPASDFSRPPRLPLPIDHDPEPTSPIATPQDVNTPMETTSEVDLGQRPGSMLSSTTLDDDEVADIETFTLESDPYSQKVLTTLEWRGDGRSVYVTGTFAHWERKFRMQKMQKPDGSSAFVLNAPLPTGTHHIKFLVDGEMVLSDHYPTTVDYTNSLVNYVEIAPSRPPAENQVPAEPVPIPGQSASAATDHARPMDIRPGGHASETSSSVPSTLQETIVPPPAPSGAVPQAPGPAQELEQLREAQQTKAPPKKQLPRPKYTSQIPEYLLHVDLYNTPEDERFRRATKATSHMPQPPSLPMFMSKSILNAATPHKDDASVLTMPNHTVLNHLATSSIKNGVLATSGTTRYKRKFLTTIMYRPTSE